MIVQMEKLYGTGTPEQRLRYVELDRFFEEKFPGESPVFHFSAPGRTEIGGNHTDHNHGHVVAAAVDLDVIAAVRPAEDGVIRLESVGHHMDTVDTRCRTPQDPEREHSASLIRGISARLFELGYRVGGFHAVTTSKVLKGSGLSSSAAFEILVVTILNHLYNDGKIDPITAAQVSKYAENEFFGKPSGLLDQMASSVGGFTAMDFADPASPKVEQIDLDLTKYGYALCVVDTGGSHSDLTGEYAAVPAEMRAVASFFGKEFLRDVDEDAFYRNIPALRSAAGDRAVLRAIHFFDDDRAAVQEKETLKAGDFDAFLRLVAASGRSSETHLQNVFAPQNPKEQGITLALALIGKILAGRGAYRVHGGGFAGTVQAYVPLDMLESFRERIEAVFGAGSCYVLRVRSVGGVRVE